MLVLMLIGSSVMIFLATHTLFQEIRLVAQQTRGQLPDSCIYAKFVDFALCVVEEMVRQTFSKMIVSDDLRPLNLYLYLLHGDIKILLKIAM